MNNTNPAAEPPEIRLIQEHDIESFYSALSSVVLEQKYLAFTEPPAFESTRTFVKKNIADGIPQYVAVAGNQVLGWCDICPRSSLAAHAHSAGLGMGLIAEARGQGIGFRLIMAAIEHAKRLGWTRIELEVYTSNKRAIRLYERAGFEHEGIKKKNARIAGEFLDSHIMALVTI